MRIIGLTGSIGMGKSATLALFAAEGCAVWDADAAVHRLYEAGGQAVGPIKAAFPGVVIDGAVDRGRLSARLSRDPAGYARLEAIVHPLVQADRQAWLARARAGGFAVAVVDVPLLFETGGDGEVDAVVVASAPLEVQRRRVLARPGMTPERLEEFLARQTPDADKRARADFVIDTGRGLALARDQVRAVLEALSTPGWRSGRPDGLFQRDEAGE